MQAIRQRYKSPKPQQAFLRGELHTMALPMPSACVRSANMSG